MHPLFEARRLGTGLALATILLLTVAAHAPAAELRVHYSWPAALVAGLGQPNASPPGANDWSCRPTPAHPRPVILVHGTAENMYINWRALSPRLRNDGYCVFALNYGAVGSPRLPTKGLGSIADSAQELATFVDRVLSRTGAPMVDIVGHSQGGMMPRHYLRFLGGASKVHHLVGLSSSNHGTDTLGLNRLANALPLLRAMVARGACRSCTDQLEDSPFIRRLNAGGDTIPGIRYTVITTRLDQIVHPYTSSYLYGPNTRTIDVQDGCPWDFTDHLAIPYDRRALSFVLDALDPSRSVMAPCPFVLPIFGG